MAVTSRPTSLPSCSALPAALWVPWLGTEFPVEVSHQFLTSVRVHGYIHREILEQGSQKAEQTELERKVSQDSQAPYIRKSEEAQYVKIRLHL